MNQTLAEIIKGCTFAKRSSQEQLFKMFSDELFGVCRYYTNNYEEAQDVLQDSFIKIFEKINQYSHQGSFVGWMRKIVINTALSVYRNKKYSYSIDDEDLHIEIKDQYVEEEQSAEVLLGMIQNLSPQYRMVFNLYAIEGYSHKEISKMLDISEGTSKSNLSRARSILQSKVHKHKDFDI